MIMSDGAMIVMIFAIIIFVPLICIFAIYKISRRRRKSKNERYTCETPGIITDLRLKGSDGPFVMTVSYSVNGIEYTVKESVKLKSSTIKAGAIPVGQRKTPVIGDIRKGSSVTVKHDPADPARALIKGNDGFITG